jgi:hypothetical protein
VSVSARLMAGALPVAKLLVDMLGTLTPFAKQQLTAHASSL